MTPQEKAELRSLRSDLAYAREKRKSWNECVRRATANLSLARQRIREKDTAREAGVDI